MRQYPHGHTPLGLLMLLIAMGSGSILGSASPLLGSDKIAAKDEQGAQKIDFTVPQGIRERLAWCKSWQSRIVISTGWRRVRFSNPRGPVPLGITKHFSANGTFDAIGMVRGNKAWRLGALRIQNKTPYALEIGNSHSGLGFLKPTTSVKAGRMGMLVDEQKARYEFGLIADMDAPRQVKADDPGHLFDFTVTAQPPDPQLRPARFVGWVYCLETPKGFVFAWKLFPWSDMLQARGWEALARLHSPDASARSGGLRYFKTRLSKIRRSGRAKRGEAESKRAALFHFLVPYLVEACGDRSGFVRREATSILGSMGPSDKALVPDLRRMLQERDTRVRYAAAVALSHLSPGDGKAIAALANALSARDVDIRSGAANELEALGPKAAPAVAALTKAVKDRNPRTNVARRAANALGAIGPQAKAAAPVLADAIKEGGTLGIASIYALRNIGPETVAAFFRNIANATRDASMRQAAISALGTVPRPQADAAIRLVRKYAKDRNKEVRKAAEGALRLLNETKAGAKPPASRPVRGER